MKQSHFFDTLRNYHTQLCVEFRNAHTDGSETQIKRVDRELVAVEKLIEFYRDLPDVEGE